MRPAHARLHPRALCASFPALRREAAPREGLPRMGGADAEKGWVQGAPRPSPLRAQIKHSPHCLLMRSRPVTDSARSFASGAQEPQDADFQSAHCMRCPIRSHGILSLRRSAGNSSGGTVRDGHTCDAHPAQRTPRCTHCRWRRQLQWDERSCGLIPVLSVHRPPLGSSERNAQKGGGASHCKA